MQERSTGALTTMFCLHVDVGASLETTDAAVDISYKTTPWNAQKSETQNLVWLWQFLAILFTAQHLIVWTRLLDSVRPHLYLGWHLFPSGRFCRGTGDSDNEWGFTGTTMSEDSLHVFQAQ